MTENEIMQAIDQGESRDWEFKSAAGGLPASLWETYSALANSDGGTIVLGIEERDEQFIISGLPHPQRALKDFWNTVNNRGKVSTNLLVDQDVYLRAIGSVTVMVIQIPRATRRQRPVYIGQNPLLGTFRRNHDGDYRCTVEEVGRLLADQAEVPADARILPFLTLEQLDIQTIQQYRQLFSATKPEHPWLLLDTREFLARLGGWRKDNLTGEEGITVAGVLMFGREEIIRDPAVVPQYHVDYREKLSADAGTRWDDRLVPDGTWEANLFQYYQQAIRRLLRDLKVPFQLNAEMRR
ncbi:MAG: RNA-binding domain-containing protein, partial [bacterium]